MSPTSKKILRRTAKQSTRTLSHSSITKPVSRNSNTRADLYAETSHWDSAHIAVSAASFFISLLFVNLQLWRLSFFARTFECDGTVIERLSIFRNFSFVICIEARVCLPSVCRTIFEHTGFNLRLDDELAVRRARVLFEIILVVGLRRKELLER